MLIGTAEREMCEFAPKWDTMRGVFPMASPSVAAPEQEFMFCWFQSSWKNQGQKLSVHFLSVNNALMRFVHNNMAFEYLKEHFLGEWCVPHPCLLCEALLRSAALLWVLSGFSFQVSSPSQQPQPQWQWSHLWQLQIPHPRFFLHYPAPVGSGRQGRKG